MSLRFFCLFRQICCNVLSTAAAQLLTQAQAKHEKSYLLSIARSGSLDFTCLKHCVNLCVQHLQL